MDFFEFVFDFKTEYLDKMIFNEFKLTANNVKSSHFYDIDKQRDVEFHEIASFSEFFTKPGTGTITVKQLQLGTILEEFLILLSFDGESGTIDINFAESELIENHIFNKEKCLKLMEYFSSFMERYDVKSARFGYEPATDEDTCLIELKEGATQIKDLVDRL
jgi:hypothetical protein